MGEFFPYVTHTTHAVRQVWSLLPGMLLPPSPESVSLVCDLCSQSRPHTQKGLTLGFNALLLLSWVLHFIFELEFCKWSLMRQRSIHTSRGDHAICISTVPYCLIHLEPSWYAWAQNSSRPTTQESLERFKVQGKHWVSGGRWEHKRPCFPFEPALIWMQKGNGILSSTNDPGTLSHPLLFMLLSCTSHPVMLKMMPQKQR